MRYHRLISTQDVAPCPSCLRLASSWLLVLSWLNASFCLQSIGNGSALKGAAFWAWYDEGQVGPEGEGGGDGWYGIRDSSSTFVSVRKAAQAIAR